MADEAGEVRNQKLDPEAEARRRLALAQVRQYPDPVLRMKANDVEAFDEDLSRLIERLSSLLKDANGLGLAATQTGVLRRVFVFQPDPEEPAVALVNPRLADGSEEKIGDEEGCLSLQGVVIPVDRHERITVEASIHEPGRSALRSGWTDACSRASRRAARTFCSASKAATSSGATCGCREAGECCRGAPKSPVGRGSSCAGHAARRCCAAGRYSS